MIKSFTNKRAQELYSKDKSKEFPGQASLFQAAIRNDQYKLIYKYPGPIPNQPELELYDVMDIEENNPVVNAAANALLLSELDGMWISQGYDPTTGLCP